MSWMSGRAAPADRVVTVRGDLLGRAGRRQLVRELRSRYVRNLWSLGPMLTGAAMAGHLSRRSTRAVGRRVARDLGIRP